MSTPWERPLAALDFLVRGNDGEKVAMTPTADVARALVHRANAYEGLVEVVRALIADVQDEHEAHEAEDEGFIVALHVPYGDVLRARRTLEALEDPS